VDARRLELIMTVQRETAALQLEIDRCRNLLACVLDDNLDEHGLMQVSRFVEEKRREASLQGVLEEAISVLDESRKAFKSKQLEMLRKKLTRALAQC
jgi:hypothetical protein